MVWILMRLPSLGQAGFAAPWVVVRLSEVADALVVQIVVIVVEEGRNGGFEFALYEVVFLQDAVIQGLMPSFHFILGLRKLRRATASL